ncbi:dockerin type I domain-containing protein [Ruminiclostridium josui]|uniref:dockerin type I domain-containing protein n=1 Tax=Ruminiclostridium josui TaxID=1499 RepID=UPI000B2F5CE9
MDWSIQSNLQVGDSIYGDRTFKFVQIPQSLIGSEWIRTACDSKLYASDEASFTAKSDITVYVALDTRVTNIPAWLGNWTKTGESLNSDNALTYNIYKKDFTAGSSVILGTNGASSSVVNYTVIVKPKSTIINGDVNRDGAVDALDFALVKKYLLNGVTDGMDLQAADMNNDNSINAIDLALIKGYILGISK